MNSRDAMKPKEKAAFSQAQALGRDFPLCVCLSALGMCSYVNAGRCVFVAVLKAIDLRATGSERASQPTLLVSDGHNVCVVARRHVGYRRTDNIKASYGTEMLTLSLHDVICVH